MKVFVAVFAAVIMLAVPEMAKSQTVTYAFASLKWSSSSEAVRTQLKNQGFSFLARETERYGVSRDVYIGTLNSVQARIYCYFTLKNELGQVEVLLGGSCSDNCDGRRNQILADFEGALMAKYGDVPCSHDPELCQWGNRDSYLSIGTNPGVTFMGYPSDFPNYFEYGSVILIYTGTRPSLEIDAEVRGKISTPDSGKL